MQLISESLIISSLKRLFLFLYALWNESCLMALCSRFARFLSRVWRGSFFCRAAARSGVLYRQWKTSRIVQLCTHVINAVPIGLHALHRRFASIWEGSLIMRALYYIGEHTAALISWLFFALLVCPQDAWNNMYSLAGVIIILLFFWLAGMRHKSLRLELKHVGIYPVIYACFALLFTVLSRDTSSSLRFFMFHLTCMVAVLLCVGAVKSWDELKRIVLFALAGVAIASIYAFYQRASGLEVDKLLVDITASSDTPGRVFSFFENPNSFAMVLVMLLPLGLGMTIACEGRARIFSLAAFILGALALVMTYSRGAWLGFLISLLVMVIILKPRLVPLFVLLCVLAIPLLPDSVVNRFMSSFNTSDTSIASRKDVYEATWMLIKRHPFRGVGLGSDVVRDSVNVTNMYKSTTIYIHAHDLYLQIAAEMGLGGLLAFLASMISSFKAGLHVVTGRRGSKALRAVIASAIAGFTGVLIYGIVDYPWSYPRVMLIFWMLFAVLLSCIRLAGEEKNAIQ